MSKKAYKSSRITSVSQDSNREFISFFVCISAIGVVLLSALLYKGESEDLQDGWLQDLQTEEHVYFGVLSNG
jgi:hypothetical protein